MAAEPGAIGSEKDMIELERQMREAQLEADKDGVSQDDTDAQLRLALERERVHLGEIRDIHPKGGLQFSDENMIKLQRRVMWEFVKELGWNVAQGKGQDLVKVSLPVRIFEPRSFLQRLTDAWAYAPVLLSRASKSTDPIERFKCVIAFAVAGLHMNVSQWKPFNPILGETLEAEWEDGTKIYLEQTSHHPPVSHWEVFGPASSYKFIGYAQWSAAWRGNALKGSQTGPNIVEFKDGTKIAFSLPYLWLKGILWGDRVAEYLGEMKIRDRINNLECTLKFNPDAVGYLQSFLWSAASPSDVVRGEILRDGKVVSKVEGSWIKEIKFDGISFLDVRSMKPAPLKSKVDPLPSDCRFRDDLLALQTGDYNAAQAKKVELEEKQRDDRKLRRAGYEKRQQPDSFVDDGAEDYS